MGPPSLVQAVKGGLGNVAPFVLACLLILSLSGLVYVAISRRQSHSTLLSILFLTIFPPPFHDVPSHRWRSCAIDEFSSKYHYVFIIDG